MNTAGLGLDQVHGHPQQVLRASVWSSDNCLPNIHMMSFTATRYSRPFSSTCTPGELFAGVKMTLHQVQHTIGKSLVLLHFDEVLSPCQGNEEAFIVRLQQVTTATLGFQSILVMCGNKDHKGDLAGGEFLYYIKAVNCGICTSRNMHPRGFGEWPRAPLSHCGIPPPLERPIRREQPEHA